MELPENNLSQMRISYERSELTEQQIADNPLDQFNLWLADAVDCGTDSIPEPNAMVLSTIGSEGQVHSRTVLLKGLDPAGLVFYTNYESQKGQDIKHDNRVSVLFPWYPLHRQVIVTGTVAKIPSEDSQQYFDTRPHKSKLGALVSSQSQVISGRTQLEQDLTELELAYPEGSQVPLPASWGGYRIQVDSMEFWQGRRSRLHDRLKFIRANESGLLNQAAAWQITRLSP
jgi:pyridoxamine 5'-phosphate oxidase